MEGPAAWSRLGWQGITFDVPADWCPARLEGDFANGYLRVEDEWNVRLELRWETLRRRVPSASQLVDNYLRQTQRKLGRRAPKPTVNRDRCVPQLGDTDHEVFTWRGAFNAHSLLLVCPETKRAVHLRVFFETGKELRELTRRVFASVATTSEDGRNEWNVFGLGFRVARSWRLESSALRTGCLQFVFSDDRDVLDVVRLSLATMLLGERPLGAWFGEFFAKALRRYRYQTHAGEYRGHPAVRVEGTMRPRARPLGLLRRKLHVTGLAWHCKADDRLFAIRVVSREAGDGRTEACADTISCT
jgi:hypothetical protein